MAYKFQLGAYTASGSLTQEGAVESEGTLTVGSDGAGADVTFHSDTTGDYMMWDASEEQLKIVGTSGQVALDIDTGNLTVGAYGLTDAGAATIASMAGNWTNVGRTVADMGILTTVDINGGSMDGVTIGAASAGAATFTTVAGSTGTFSGILKTDDTTNATSTTDGSLQTDGGLSVAADAVIGDDLILLSDAAVIHFGANKDVTLTHVADVGLTITHTGTGDNLPVVLQLKSEEDAVIADEVIASMEFAAGDSDGTDGATVAAGIHAIAEETFAADANATKLVFTTADSETAAASATAKMTLASTGNLTTAGSITAVGSFIIGSADMSEADLEKLDGITNGTAAASKAMVLDANADISGARNVTITGEIDAASGDFSGNIDVDGIANLDAVDIDGAVQIDGAVTVGVDGTGQDVKMFGDTTGKYLLWDQSGDELVLAGANTKISFYDAAGGENISADGSGHMEVNAGTTLDMTAPTIDLNASTAVTMDTPSFTVASSAEDKPVITLKNTYSGLDGPELRFVMDKGAAGADNDSAGMISFYADDDNQDNIKFGQIQVQVSDASNNNEGGKMAFSVANHDGGEGVGLLIEDGSEDNEIDVTVAKGANSITSIAGDLTVTSHVNIGDSKSIKIGASTDMELVHDGTHSYIKNKTGTLKIATETSGVAITLGHSTSVVTVADDLTIVGDLTVQGTTKTVNVEMIDTSNGIIFEGSSDDAYETTLKAENPTADHTYHLPDLGNSSDEGWVAAFAANPANSSATLITATPAEVNYLDITTIGTAETSKALTISASDTWTVVGMTCANLGTVTTIDINGGSIDGATLGAASAVTITNADMNGGSIDGVAIGAASAAAGTFTTLACNGGALSIAALDIDGGTDIGEALVDADLLIVDNGAGGTNRKCTMARLKTYMGSVAVATKANGGTLAVGVNYFADMSDDGEDSVTLPASAGMTIGESVKVKAPSDCSAARYITINKAGSQTIDGATSIRLESPFAAVELVYVAADTWRVF